MSEPIDIEELADHLLDTLRDDLVEAHGRARLRREWIQILAKYVLHEPMLAETLLPEPLTD